MASLSSYRPQMLAGIGPGLLASLVIAVAATFLADHYGGPVMLFALLLGMAMNFLSDVDRCRPGIQFASKTVLRLGVAMLGFRITLQQIVTLGWKPVALVIGLVTLTILASIWLARRMGFEGKFGLLTGGATAICGASAAAAISAALPPDPQKERNTLFTIIGVSTLSTLAMIVYPVLIQLLRLDHVHYGMFIGATVHDVAQVVGAGYAISPEAGDTATVVKLMRVAMLLPVIIATTMMIRAKGAGHGERPPILPWFLAVFLALVAANSLLPVPVAVQEAGGTASRWCLVAAIAALGVRTQFKEMLGIGWKPVALMVIETLIIAGLALAAIGLGWV
ncbi:putative sulfate exporter family transporter [Sphingomonas sp. RB56-2]|uniref:Sulfate exporter family transporter n=1 Tax=Sphingomonas brevis TaxID=2908206 RepID=A0ABT0S800_9SPHN|nr:putative sulfate exporter family transporter [Sphingomonas brevis]MCL6740545.1 putative sulfate exporter family transporter [Sphingomonas brevis]